MVKSPFLIIPAANAIPVDYDPYVKAKETDFVRRQQTNQLSKGPAPNKLNAFHRSKLLEQDVSKEASSIPPQLLRLIPASIRDDPVKVKRFEAFWLEETG